MGRWIWMWMIRLEQDHSTCNIQQHRSGTRPVCGRRVRPGGTEGDGGSASAVRLESPRTYERWASNLKASCSARSDSAWFRSSIRPAIYSSLQSEPKSLRGTARARPELAGGERLEFGHPLEGVHELQLVPPVIGFHDLPPSWGSDGRQMTVRVQSSDLDGSYRCDTLVLPVYLCNVDSLSNTRPHLN